MGRPANRRELGYGTAVQRILRRVERVGDHWLWPRRTTRPPQIRVSVGGVTWTESVARILWESDVGPVPDGAVLAQGCNSERCVLPAHRVLYNNLAEQAVANFGLSDLQLAALGEHLRGGATIAEAAARLGVSRETVCRIVRGIPGYVGGSYVPPPRRSRAEHRCSTCRRRGHTRTTCTEEPTFPWEQAS